MPKARTTAERWRDLLCHTGLLAVALGLGSWLIPGMSFGSLIGIGPNMVGSVSA